jgi:hypothetical protein
MEDPETEELRIDQVRRERAEREQAADAELPKEEQAHERRASKHAYLREKLQERARSEEEGQT